MPPQRNGDIRSLFKRQVASSADPTSRDRTLARHSNASDPSVARQRQPYEQRDLPASQPSSPPNRLVSSQSSLTQYDTASSQLTPQPAGHHDHRHRDVAMLPGGDVSRTPSSRHSSSLELRSPKPIHSSERRPVGDRLDNTSLARSAQHPLNSSFNSLSSAPATSQASSRRVLKSGLPAVTNSDSGSDDDSDDDLMDPRSFFPVKRRRLTPLPEDEDDPEDVIALSTTSKPAQRKESPLMSAKKASTNSTSAQKSKDLNRSYNFSLARMVQDQKRREKTEAAIAAAEAAIERADQLDLVEIRDGQVPVDATAAAIALVEDGDERERMRNAMERTEALRRVDQFHYITSDEPQPGDQDFPVDALPAGSDWHKILEDESSRTHACATGFARDLVFYNPLPAVVLEWMAARTLYETREDICEAYTDIILTAIENHGISGLEFLASLRSFYQVRAVGKQSENLPSTGESQLSEPSHDAEHKNPPAALPRGFVYAVDIACFCAQHCPLDIRIDTVWDLILLNIDVQVQRNDSARSRVWEALESLMESVSESDTAHLYTQMCQHYSSSEDCIGKLLSLQLLAEIPSISPELRLLRQNLALHSIFQDDGQDYLSTMKNSLTWLERIRSVLQTSDDFHISKDTDYDVLNWLVLVLDIALEIDRPLLPEATDSCADDKMDAKSAGRKPFSFQLFDRSVVESKEERAFNNAIDMLSSQLRHIFSLIRDAGTGFLRRSEVKNTIERLMIRLDLAVRTRAKPKDIFAGKTSGYGDGLNGSLDGFLMKQAAAKGGLNVIDENEFHNATGTDVTRSS